MGVACKAPKGASSRLKNAIRGQNWQRRAQLLTWAHAEAEDRMRLRRMLAAADDDQPGHRFWDALDHLASEAKHGQSRYRK
eukprot:10095374-Alexandrium_andersonii.AAC.1